ncbi:MAG: gamma-glutamyltransferase [Novosphingobium sp.]
MPHYRSVVLAALLLSAGAAPAFARTATPQAQLYPQGMVSAADPRAAEAGAEILRAGGSATDAAIAVMLALGVVEPQSSGIGGGGFLLAGNAAGEVETIDGRETAPAGAGPDWFLDTQGQPLGFRQAVIGGLSVGVPGNIALAAEAHRRHGRLAWSALFGPAIRLARGGWTLNERSRAFLERSRDTGAHDPAGHRLFYDAAGQPLAIGTKLRNPVLAATLNRLARRGAAAFYTGGFATRLAAKIASETPRAGAMTRGDVAGYKAKVRAPVCGSYRVYRICGMGPPSSGATTVFATLKQLERFDMAAYSPRSPVAWHLIAESERLAYADRDRYLADPDFVAVPVSGLTDPAYLAARGALISPDHSLPTVAAGIPVGVALAPPIGGGPDEHGTSHFVVADRAGNVVSYTSTVEGSFGSGLVYGGFYLNNELTDFSFAPAKDGAPVANRVAGGKRPRSSMAPTLVYGPDGALVVAVGAAGGATIPAQVARVLIGMLDWKLSARDAIALPVIFAPADSVFVEKGSALEAMIPALLALGHAKVQPQAMPLKANAIGVVAGRLDGAADPRSEGVAIAQ